MRLEALEQEPQAFSSAAEDHARTTVEDAAVRIDAAANGSFLLGAFEGDRLTATAGFYREQELKSRHKGRVWGVYVTADARGRGVGRALMEALIRRARACPGLEQIMLTVTPAQVAALHLYHSLGFRTFGKEPRALCVEGKYLDEEYLVLTLV